MTNSKIAAVSFTTVTLLLILTRLSAAFIQEIQFHESVHHNETVYTFRRNEPDTSRYNFSQFKSLCVRGRWMAYNVRNYSEESQHDLFSTDSQQMNCINLHSNNHHHPWKFLSFRHVGHINTAENAISLYSMTNMGGSELYISRSPFAGIQGSVKSLGWTGSSSWTLFEGTNFDGASACIRHSSYYGHYHGQYNDVMSSLKLSTVGSLFKGCSVSLNSSYIQFMRDAWAQNLQL